VAENLSELMHIKKFWLQKKVEQRIHMNKKYVVNVKDTYDHKLACMSSQR